MGIPAELLSFLIVCTAQVIFPAVRAVNCCQFHSAIFTVQTAGKKVYMGSLASVLAVVAAVFDFI